MLQSKFDEAPRLTDCCSYYDKIKNNKHIFIYAVAGRSSSTFLQRLLNSSGEVCIYGEFHYLIDKLLDTLQQMMQMNQGVKGEIAEPWMIHTKNSHDKFVKALQSGKHDSFYPNAIRDMDVSIEMLKEALANMLKPLNEIERFGYKEIRLQYINTLRLLRELFPESYFIFQFRNPLEQWNSIKNFSGTFPYSKDCQSFLLEYQKLAESYILISLQNPHHHIFVSDQTTCNIINIHNLIKKIDIAQIDTDLLIKRVGASQTNKSITPEEKELIINSQAYSYYLQMSAIEIENNIELGNNVDIKQSDVKTIAGENLYPNPAKTSTAVISIKTSHIQGLLAKIKRKLKTILSTKY